VKQTIKALSMLVVCIWIVGCTRSFEANYKLNPLPTVVPKQAEATIAIARFVDKRSFVRASDKKSDAYIATQSPWQFGLTYKGRQFIPISDLLQDIFAEEFNQAGLKASKLIEGTTCGADYVLGGEIINFEFANDAGMWRVTSRRSVTITLDLKRADNSPVFVGQLFNESDTENEGMGVLHTTNVDKLVNSVLKKVVTKAIARVAESLQVNAAGVTIHLRNTNGQLLASIRMH